jgi:hypothetical protein
MPDSFDDADREFQFQMEQQMAEAGRKMANQIADLIAETVIDAVNVLAATFQADLRKRLAAAPPPAPPTKEK